MNAVAVDDNGLTSLLKNGDATAFTEIYNGYWDKLYYIAYKLLKDTNAAEEIVQDVFLNLWKNKEGLEIVSLAGYLAAMTRYSVYHYLSKEKKSRVKEEKLGQINEGAVAEFNVDHKILLQIVTELSNKLPEKCRLVFQYNKLHDQPLAEVARNLNISQKTAEGHLTKALRVIRDSLGATPGEFLLLMIAMMLSQK
ncbi:sigma-70 family RNA polymerase sigma factor [Mucilaginibacter dorajii]|uniref:RNA polymerase sigma-70 factor n=1 Tax=Mucilaginibacter dorajii TaxID=692994 RepID=A0ABP7P1G6_9SPHI|nr:sigma-70 family RNA polymerase sigma factor [Mucilaginibacter dorajii]MCS3735510.1 RNA polymerase sigma-70 factor (ECF subfamily) [Mucilaginibacter dorajii]